MPIRNLTAPSIILAGSLAAIAQDDRIHMDIIDADVTDAAGVNHRAEAEKTIQSGFGFWESVLPRYGTAFYTGPSGTNFTFRIHNYQGPGGGGTGSFCSGSWACFTGSEILWNSHANASDNSITAPLRLNVNSMDFAHRDTYWNEYQPTTILPLYYGVEPNNNGFVNGIHPKGMSDYDWLYVSAHEVGHRLGFSHQNMPDKDKIAWYWRPYYMLNGVKNAPAQPFLKSANYPSLWNGTMATLFGTGGYGGGSCNPDGAGACAYNSTSYTNRPGNPGRWFPDFRWAHLKDRYGFMTEAPPLPGMASFHLGRHNQRVLNWEDARQLQDADPARPVDYPGIKGLIRMQKPSGGGVYLTSDWQDAYTQTGLGNDVQGSSPYFVTDIFPKVRSRRILSAGGDATFGIKYDGTAWCWGNNGWGQLGVGLFGSQSSPVQGPTGVWGNISLGEKHAIGVRRDKTLWGWGSNANGQLGVIGIGSTNTPVQEDGKTADWHTADAGSAHTVALKTNGEIWSWGAGGEGQLGNGSVADQPRPVRVAPVNGYLQNDWVAVAAGAYHTVALKADGSLWTWGNNTYGQLGRGNFGGNQTTPQSVSVQGNTGIDKDWVAIDAGYYHTLALKRDGSVWAWGYNDDGELGSGNRSAWYYPSRVREASLPGTAPIRAIAAGYWHSCAISTANDLYCWGYNGHGEIGTGNLTDALYAVKVGGTTKYDEISAGAFHTVALAQNGALYSWGLNSGGQLGDGTFSGDVASASHASRYGEASAVYLSSPSRGAVVVGESNPIQLVATASGQVTKVEFWDGATKLGEDATAPYQWTWNNATAGYHTLTVKAVDIQGFATKTSSRTIAIKRINITESDTPAGTAVTLSGADGALDWFHLGYSSGTSVVRKTPNPGLMGIWTPSGNGRRTDFPISASWTGGTPVASATNTRSGMTLPLNNLAWWSAKMTNTQRVLKVYVTALNADISLSANCLGTTISRTFTNTTSTQKGKVFTFTFWDTAAENQDIYFNVTSTRIGTGGYAGLQAVTLK